MVKAIETASPLQRFTEAEEDFSWNLYLQKHFQKVRVGFQSEWIDLKLIWKMEYN